MLTKACVMWGQHSVQELLAPHLKQDSSVMRCEVKSGGPALGVMAAVIVLFLVGFFFPSLFARFVCLHACVCVRPLFLTLLCNAVSDLGKNMRQRDRERAEWMCDHFNLCVILDCTTSYLTSHRAALTRARDIINSAYSFPYVHALRVTCSLRYTGTKLWCRWHFWCYFKHSQYSSFNQACLKQHAKKVKFPFKTPLINSSQKQSLHCNKDLVTGVKKENRLADKPPKLEPIPQDDINIIALVPKTTLYWFA